MVKRGYPLNQSPFYRLSNKRRLADLLGFDLKQFDALVGDENYHVFPNKQKRWIEHPIGALAPVHKKIASLLSRIALPNYLHSRRGRSYVSNAAAHAANAPLIKTDISSFYPSTSFGAVHDLFRLRFECSPDVAWHLARICCFQGKFLPTGSHLSGIVAFLAHQPMFDEIYALSARSGCTMTCYVDDIVLSGVGANKALLHKVRRVIARHGLTAKPSKSKVFEANVPKVVTGVVIGPDGLSVPNKQFKNMRLDRRLLKRTANPAKRERLINSISGRRQAMRQITKYEERQPS